MKVGIAGLGKMGMVFADRIKAAGLELAVWNRTPEKATKVNGATAAATAADLAARSNIVLTIVSDDAAVKDVYQGAKGLLSGDVKEKLFVEMSTVLPATHIEIAKAVAKAGGRFIECPVGGSVKVASEGKLLGFAGGDAADIEKARPVLEALCRRIDHAGPVGAGAALKLAINLPLMVYWQALGEAVALTRDYGFKPEWLVELFAESSGGPNMLKVRGPSIAKALAGEEVPLSVDVATMRKDLGLMLAEAKAKGNASPLVKQVHASFGRAEKAGLSGMDCSAFPAYWVRQGSRAR
jgi:3-hydroxyisobutyrate dehydrogenase